MPNDLDVCTATTCLSDSFNSVVCWREVGKIIIIQYYKVEVINSTCLYYSGLLFQYLHIINTLERASGAITHAFKVYHLNCLSDLSAH